MYCSENDTKTTEELQEQIDNQPLNLDHVPEPAPNDPTLEDPEPPEPVDLNDPTLADPDAGDPIAGSGEIDITFKSIEEVQLGILSSIVKNEELLVFAMARIDPYCFVDRHSQSIASIAFEYYRKYRTLPPEPAFKIIIKNELKQRHENKKDILVYYGKLNEVFEYCYELFTIEYVKTEIAEHHMRIQAKRMMAHAMKDIDKRKEMSAVIESLSQGVRDVKALNESKKRNAFFLEELEKLGNLKWLIDNHLYDSPDGCFATLFGPSGSGKSFIALDYSLCIATGTPYLGIHRVKKGKVAYICSEGQLGIWDRAKAWLQHRGIKSDHNIAFIPSSFDLMKTGEADELMLMVKNKLDENPALIVIDTLSRNIGTGDDRSNDLNTFIANVDYIRFQTGATVLVIHHTGHENQQRPRGGKNLVDASDCMIRVTPKNPDDIARNEQSTIHQFKIKESDPFKDYQLLKTIVDVEGREPSCVWVLRDPLRTRLEGLADGPHWLLRMIYKSYHLDTFNNSDAERLEIPTQGDQKQPTDRTKRRYMKQLEEDGFLINVERGRSRIDPRFEPVLLTQTGELN